MGYYQSALKKCGMSIIGIFVALSLAAGCATHKTENMTPESTVQAPESKPDKKLVSSSPRSVERITVSPEQDALEVWIQGSETLEYTSIKQSFPFGVSVYMPDTELGINVGPESVTDNRISGVKAGYADKDKTTVKVEILLNQDLPYIVQEDGNRLGIILQGSVGSKDVESAVASGIETSDTVEGASVEEGKIVIPSTTANLTNIEFETKETGHSDIKIKTD
ncbi:MAG: type IV pilus secretin PilQ, partial [Desulfobacterales bacterium]|nr:type IV pilus secretin PilQ [Desulfobacterales bacterium]